MATFKFFENCTFCQSRIGSTHCLLPFQFTRDYIAPEDEVSKIIDVTEIHMHYGIQSLKSNFEIIHWMKTRPTSDQIVEYSRFVQDRTTEWFQPPVPSLGMHLGVQSSYTEGSSQTESSNEQSSIKSQIEGIALKETHDLETQTEHIKMPKSTESDQIKSALWPKSSPPGDTLTKVKDEVPQDDTTLKIKRPNEISRDNELHVVQDMIIAAKTAYNLHAKQRSSMRLSQLIEALIHESNIRSLTNTNYRPTLSSDLDGFKALSKELIARHSHEETQKWESGKCTKHSDFCILNYSQFLLIRATKYDPSIEDTLCQYFLTTSKNERMSKEQLTRILNSVKFELDRQGHQATLAWIGNRIKLPNILRIAADSKSKSSEGSETKGKLKHPYPAIDQRVLDHISSHLQIIVDKRIDEANTLVPTMTNETKTTSFLFKLASEFLLRNKGWHNENSFTGPQHLTKLEEQTGMYSKENEAFFTFNLIRNILNDFRKSFKEKYPKYG